MQSTELKVGNIVYVNFLNGHKDVCVVKKLDKGVAVLKSLDNAGKEEINISSDEQWKMGNVLEDSFDLSMKERFAKANVYSKPECKNCWAKFYCSGGCNANNWQYEGDILHSHPISCELEKKRIECAIMIQAALSE